ncbi:unnamed protein product [Durusdinium trenchii]|uniref:C3H1-type domain-containing protein n=1 Tax=Durusdinium trenchii TaxID=1381693 RepID=A0ABP0SPB1_9DINO
MDADKAASLQSTLRQARFAEGEAEREPAGWPSAAKAPGPRFRKLSTGATELPDDDEEREELSPAATDSDEDECPTQPPSRGHPDVGANGLRFEPQKVVPTPGSQSHGTGRCKPCLWFWKPQGCQKGNRCSYCHLCPPNEFTVRKKLTRRSSRKETTALDMIVRPPPGLEETVPELSIGQVLHLSGRCRPCGAFFRGKCTRGEECFHCHLCLSDEARRTQAREELEGPTISLPTLML